MSILTKRNTVIGICSMMPFIAIFLIMHYFSVILDKKNRQVDLAFISIERKYCRLDAHEWSFVVAGLFLLTVCNVLTIIGIILRCAALFIPWLMYYFTGKCY
jgi:hypothetical protein